MLRKFLPYTKNSNSLVNPEVYKCFNSIFALFSGEFQAAFHQILINKKVLIRDENLFEGDD